MLKGLEAVDGLTEEQQKAINELAGGLLSKNQELLDKLSSTKAKAHEGQSAAEELAAIKALQEQRELEAKQQYDNALKLNAEKYTKQIEELTGKVSAYESEKRESMISGSIAEALKEARVSPLHLDYVTTYFKTQAGLSDDGKVMIGDKSLSDTIKEWAETDSGKAVRLAPDNSGGGAVGGFLSSQSGSGKKLSPAEQRAADINKRLRGS